MEELAAGSLGTYFHNSNDLKGGFERLLAAPEYFWYWSFIRRTQHRMEATIG
jgi:hypothetical protein